MKQLASIARPDRRRLPNLGVAVLACLSLVLGGVVILTFSAVRDRQAALTESVREDAVWAAYQLDSETKKLSLALAEFQRSGTPASLAEVGLRYDLLYSRAGLLVAGHYAEKFGRHAGLELLARRTRERILELTPAFDALQAGPGGQADRLGQAAHLAKAIEPIGHDSERLLNQANLAQLRLRVTEREKAREAYDRLALAVAALILSLALIVGYLATQLRQIRLSRNALATLSLENAEAAARAEAGARAKSIFLATMSHEIRTPLNGIIGAAELLRDSEMADHQRHKLDVITNCSDALLGLIDDILDFSKLESGSIELEKAPVAVAPLFAAVASSLQPKAQAKGVSLTVECPSILVETDPTRLRQLLFNLLGNAVKFTPSGWVKATCTIESGPTAILVEVADSGIGIDEQQSDQLFHEFRQLDVTINRRFGGSGLGLAICRRIVDAMGGEIGVRPLEPQGSCFWFRLPVAQLEQLSQEAAGPAAIAAPLPSFSGRVLLVEDSPINRQVATEMLQRLGLGVEQAPNGEIAIELAARRRYDLILMDMQMPGMDGIAATQELRRRGCELPIVALTANSLSSDRDACLAAGMNEFIAKPVNRLKLANVLRRWLAAPPHGEPQAAAEHLERGGDEPLLDRQVRSGLEAEIGAELVQNLVDNFWRDATGMISAAADAIGRGDLIRAIREVHTLKGVAGTLGFAGIEREARAVQASLEGDDHADLAALQSTLLRTVLLVDAATEEVGAAAAKSDRSAA